MANKFLGLDSINVLKQYIDEQIANVSESTRIVTIQAYSYAVNGTTPTTPIGGGFDANGVLIQYPEGWYTLNVLLSKYDDLDAILAEGAIWMTAGVAQGSAEILWSTPIKITGATNTSTRFKYTYSNDILSNEQIEDLNSYPSGVSVDNRVEYVWTQSGDTSWQGPTIWAMYSQDATTVHWRYCITNNDNNGEPIVPPTAGAGPWVNNIPLQNISIEYPNMWMSYQIVQAGQNPTSSGWSDPILFGHYGIDGDRKNTVKYSTMAETISVNNFFGNNYYIANSENDVTYNINLDDNAKIDGYTAKFSNIGAGSVTINSNTIKFNGSCKETTSIALNPQESIEVIYNDEKLLVIGKEL